MILKKAKRSFFVYVIFLAGFWHLAALIYSNPSFPGIDEVAWRSIELLFSGEFLQESLGPSSIRLIGSLCVVIPLAYLFALGCSLSSIFNNIFSPLIYTTFSLPKVALYPILLVLIGIGSMAQSILIGIGTFYLLFANLDIGFRRVLQSELRDLATVYNVSASRFVFDFLIKGSFINFLIGLKAAIAYGLVLVVVSESTASVNGIGHFIWKSWDQYRIVDIYSGVLILALIGLVAQFTIDRIIDRKLKLYRST